MRILGLLCEATTVSWCSEFRGYFSGGLPETRVISFRNFEMSDKVVPVNRLCYRPDSSQRHWHVISYSRPKTSVWNKIRKHTHSVAVLECIGTGKDAYKVANLECIGTGKDTYSLAVLECVGTGKDTHNVTVLEWLYTQQYTHPNICGLFVV